PSKETKLAALQNKLREAIEGEEYERAAKIRDQIKNLTSEN
ncbi:MAG TPA: UvrB/UvrC motif-containing protein, partial [Ignavibacteriaceae bacterium]